MRLRTRFLLMLAVMMAGLTAVAIGLAFWFVVLYAQTIDRTIATQQLFRVRWALREMTDQLLRLAEDWAYWDDMYAFAGEADSAFVERNLVPSTFERLQVDGIGYVGTNGVLWAALAPREYGEEEARVIRRDEGEGLVRALAGPIQGIQKEGYGGLIVHEGDPWLVACAPILTSRQEGPARGVLVMARRLSDERLQGIRRVVDSSFQLGTAHPRWPPEKVHIQAISPLHLIGHIGISDLVGTGRLVATVTVPRTAFLLSLRTFALAVGGTVVVGIGLWLLMVGLLDRWVFRALAESVTRLRESIRSLSQGEGMVPLVQGPDEIQSLQDVVQETHRAIQKTAAERLKQQESALLSQRMAALGTLALGVAHEINNPNMVLRLNLEAIRQALNRIRSSPIASDEVCHTWMGEMSDAVEESLRATERIEAMVRSVRGLAQGEAGPNRPGETDIREAVEEACRWVRTSVQRVGCSVETVLPEKLPVVRIERSELVQILVNLLLNACQAMTAGGGTQIRIEGRMEKAKGVVVLTVADDGPGMTTEVRQRALDPFFTTRRSEGGMGMGLPLSAALVKKAGGELTLESEPGKGTTVTVVLRIAGWEEGKTE